MKICTVLHQVSKQSIRLAYLTGLILLHPVLSSAASNSTVQGDFNGDGFADLAIGMPSKDEPNEENSGSVVIIYGSASGLSAPSSPGAVSPSQAWTQSSPGVPDISLSGDFFGSSLAAGDFNGDKFSDLAIGAPTKFFCFTFDDPFCPFRCFDGAVTVLFGSATGLTGLNSAGALISQVLTVLDIDEPSRGPLADLNVLPSCNIDLFKKKFSFGEALSSGDFNGDGFDDLAVGMPKALLQGDFLNLTKRAAGAVGIFFGSGQAVIPKGFLITPTIPRFGENVLDESIFEDGENFGSVLTSGDFNGDGFKDLAISAPLKDFKPEVKNTGVVFEFLGGNFPTFLKHSGTFMKGPSTEFGSLGGEPRAGDQFGRALAAGDFNGDGRSDLAIGTPFEDLLPFHDVGAVDVVFGASSGLSTLTRSMFITEDRIFPTDLHGFTGNHFGRALVFGDFNADGADDLAIGAPGENTLGISDATVDAIARFENSGEVSIVYGRRPNSGGRAPQRVTQFSTISSDGGPETDDHFGSTLSASNFGRNEFRQAKIGEVTLRIPVKTADLAIGAPGEDIGSVNKAGGINVIYGNALSANGLSLTNNQFWTQDSPGIPGSSANLDFFGNTLH